jgi:hypothetical protein
MNRRLLYGIAGFAGSGKNTVATTLLHRRPGKTHSFANALKDGVAAIFDLPREMLEGTTEASRLWRETPEPYWSEVFQRPMTPRRLLQEIGTEVFRQWFPSIWIAAAARRAHGSGMHLFTDARFRNEMEWIRASRGLVVWVYRNDVPHITAHDRANIAHLIRSATPLRKGCIAFEGGGHNSETAFLTEGADLIDIVIQNTDTLIDLTAMVTHLDLLWYSGELQSLPVHETTLYLSYEYGKFVWRWHDCHGYRVRYYDIMNHPLDEGYDATDTDTETAN